jgi:hypothetical protein
MAILRRGNDPWADGDDCDRADVDDDDDMVRSEVIAIAAVATRERRYAVLVVESIYGGCLLMRELKTQIVYPSKTTTYLTVEARGGDCS